MTAKSASFDAIALLDERKKSALPNRAFVTLSEAASWVAFDIALDHEALAVALEFGGADAITEARSRLISAIDRLVNGASCNRIRVRGKFFNYSIKSDHAPKVRQIPAEEFHDFARFHILNDGLFIGRGLAWPYFPEGLDMGTYDRPEVAYHSVLIMRDDLLKDYERWTSHSDDGGALETPSRSERAPAFKRGHPPKDEAILAKADEMRTLGMNGYEIAKKMRHQEGFENVPTTLVRRLIKGRRPRGPQKKLPGK